MAPTSVGRPADLATARPATPAEAPTNQSAARPTPTAVVAPTVVLVPVATRSAASEPREVVSAFYGLVEQHHFDAAEELWSSSMRSRFPPPENIVQRFSQTRSVDLRRAETVAQDPSHAAVAVDVLETNGQAGVRHFVGTWHLVRSPDGWLLDRPELQLVP